MAEGPIHGAVRTRRDGPGIGIATASTPVDQGEGQVNGLRRITQPAPLGLPPRLERAIALGRAATIIDCERSGVYDQVIVAAERAGLRVAVVSRRYDVEKPADLDALMMRLTASPDGDGPLRRVSETVSRIVPTLERTIA
jgi:hypothetical protein